MAKPVSIALISTGNELQPAGEPCTDEQIPSSNGLMLRALLEKPGVIVHDLGIVRDEKPTLAAALAQAQSCDIIITIGGASVGDHDLVRPVLLEMGAEMDFWKVAIKPGKPLMCGTLGSSIVIGLPGNPVSAYVTALLFAVPLIETMRGNPQPEEQRVSAIAGSDLPANGNRTDHIRAQIEAGTVWPVGVNDSAALLALSNADALIVREPEAPAVKAGGEVQVILLT